MSYIVVSYIITHFSEKRNASCLGKTVHGGSNSIGINVEFSNLWTFSVVLFQNNIIVLNLGERISNSPQGKHVVIWAQICSWKWLVLILLWIRTTEEFRRWMLKEALLAPLILFIIIIMKTRNLLDCVLFLYSLFINRPYFIVAYRLFSF